MLNRNATPGRAFGLFPRRALGLAAVAAVLPLAACNLDEALQVDDPFVVTPGVARDTLNLPNTFAGARVQFATAITGRQNREGGLILQSGALSDELISTDQFADRNAIDRRQSGENSPAAADPYTFLQRARAEAVNAAALFASTGQSGSEMHTDLYNIIGYSELYLAETFCSGVPLSIVDNSGQFIPSAGLTTAAVVDSAIAAFDKAIAMASANGNSTDLNLARVGKARALSFKGDYAQAATVAATVPTSFAYFVEYDAGAQESYNVVEQIGNEEERWGGVDKEGVNGLDYLSSHDPRTPWGSKCVGGPCVLYGNDGNAFDGGITGPHFSQLKYSTRGSDVMIASGMEARYIQAEAAMKAGNAASALDFVNQARAANNAFLPAATPLGALTMAEFGATTQAQTLRLFRERAFSLWLTAHRTGDLRRMQKYFGFAADQIWPIGVDKRGEAYGNDVSLTIPQSERNNPLYTGCLAPASTP